jgi:hypothetical protein
MAAPGYSWRWGGGGSKVRSLLQYPKRVHFASLMLLGNCWGPERRAPLTNNLITPRKSCAELPKPRNMAKDHQS